MAIIEQARIRETSTTTGTGTLTLNGIRYRNDRTFINGIGAGNQTFYYILDGNGIDWEAGLGEIIAPSNLARSIIYESTNNGEKIDLSANIHTVFVAAYRHI